MAGQDHPLKKCEDAIQIILSVDRGDVCPRSHEAGNAVVCVDTALTAIASRILHSPRFRGVNCDANEAVNDLFLRLSTMVGRDFEFRTPVYPLVFEIFVNICRDKGRRARVRRAKTLTWEPKSPLPTAEEMKLCGESRKRIRKALRTLSRLERRVVIDKYWGGLSARESAKRQKVAPKMIPAILFRARRKLRRILSSD